MAQSNAPDAAQGPSGHGGEGRGPAPGPADDLSAVVAWMARHHRRPFSPVALQSGLPRRPDGVRDPAHVARALALVGLRSRLVTRNLRRLDPALLPCLVFPRDGPPLVLRGFTPDRKGVRLVDPAAAGMEREMPRRRLGRLIDGQVLLVTPEADRAESRLSPDARARHARRGHWFWAPVRENANGWLLVAVAAFLVNLLGLALPLFVMNVYDRVLPNLAYVTLTTLALGVGIALLLDLLLRVVRANVLEQIGRSVDTQAASALYRHALDLRLGHHPGGAAGVASLFRDFDAVRDFFASATIVSLIDLLFIGVFIGALYLIVGQLALVALVAVPVALVLSFVLQLPLGRLVQRSQALASKRHVVLVESLTGLETVKSLNAEPAMQQEWEGAVAAASRVSGRGRVWSNLASSATMLIQQSVSVVIVVWGVFLVAEGAITVGALIAANILASRALAPMGAISHTMMRAQQAVRAMGALSGFMKLPSDRAGAIASGLRVTRGAVELRDVTYTYEGVGTPALRDVSLSVAPGEVVALLGRVGSGKTTLGRLIGGLAQPDAGAVLLDGHGSDQYDPAELRDAVGLLPQDPALFTGTLRENLQMARPDADDDALAEALRDAGMERLLSELPEGLDAFLGQNGTRLSGGQRQGLALARLLLRKPRLLFLDEPTNAMDQDMEARVTASLRRLAEAGTGLIISTHRPSLAGIAPRLVVLERGRKVLDGPRAEVLARLSQGQASAKPPVPGHAAGQAPGQGPGQGQSAGPPPARKAERG